MADTTRSTQEQQQGKPGAQQPQSGQGQTGSAARQAREYSSEYERQMGQSGQWGGQSGQEARARVSEMAGQARDTINQAYTRASRSMNDTWGQAMDYSKDHPATATLVAFGAGVGLGLFLAGSFGGFQSRSRRTWRIVPPVMDAISLVTREFLR
jgi:ElaB/YqjD/DUF883 family membrane-anchored ribosome-binding protein